MDFIKIYDIATTFGDGEKDEDGEWPLIRLQMVDCANGIRDDFGKVYANISPEMLCELFECRGRNTGFPLKGAGKIALTVEAELLGDIGDAFPAL